MPAQKRPHDIPEDDPPPPPPPPPHPLPQRNHNHREEQPEEDGNGTCLLDFDPSNHQEISESDRTRSSSCGDKDEFITVKLSEIRKEVQCPICLGIIRKTRTVMECLHRFCRECIDKSMRMGNNECPACRTHCASRRSLRDDPNYDALIAALYPDIDKYEEEELAFHEEEKARNKQIQASIAQTFRRQTEALGRKRTTAKATAAAFMRRSQGSYRRRRNRAAELEISDDDGDANGNDGGKDSSSADERCTEVKPKRSKRWGGARFSQHSSAAGSAERGGDENDSELNKETMGASVALVGNSERLAWGKGGMRSYTRYGTVGGGSGKNARTSRLSKLVNCLRNLEESEDELDIHVMLVSFDEERMPSLQRPYLCCGPSLSVRHLCQYVALQTQFQTDEVEILMAKELDSNLSSSTSMVVPISNSIIVDMCKDEMQTLEAHETLGGLQIICNSSKARLLLAYRPKASA